MTDMTTSAFEKYQEKAWPIRFSGQLHLPVIAGGVPTNPKVAEAYIRNAIIPAPTGEKLQGMVSEVMKERGVSAEEAVKIVTDTKTLNGFKRDSNGLYIEGRQLKAALKEAVSVAANAGKLAVRGWGNPTDATYKKGIKGWFPEHVFVVEDKLHLGVSEPSDVLQKFIHSRFGSSIAYEEIVTDAKISFTIETDFEFSEKQWAMIWLTGEKQGLGASRSQGFGTYVVTKWERL